MPSIPIKSLYDAVVIGGGFYGCAIAIYEARQRGLKDVLLIEREPDLLTRASYNNQARIHNGYHYPRSFTTAYRSRINFPQFLRDWPDVVQSDFTKVYAIARRNSKVTARQFQRFCCAIGAKLEPADLSLRQLFDRHLIEDVFLAEEFVFDAIKLARSAAHDLSESGVQVLLNTQVTSVSHSETVGLKITLANRNNEGVNSIKCRTAFNCTYSGLNQIGGDFAGTSTRLKHEITEMALIQVPPVLQNLGVTVMDGPFFSMMPFPPRGLHTLSHVRYTPHFSWTDTAGVNPYKKLEITHPITRVDRMLRDVGRYLPAIHDSKYHDSLFEVKTVLIKSEGDDGRPILFEKHDKPKGLISILGGKIDNIYDALEYLDEN